MRALALLPCVMLLAGPGLQAAELSRSTSFVVGVVVADPCQLSRSLQSATVQWLRAAARVCPGAFIDTRGVAAPVTAITLAKDGTITAIRLEF